MTTMPEGFVEVRCVSGARAADGRCHRFIVAADGTATADMDDNETLAELVTGNSACLTNIPAAFEAVAHRNRVTRRDRRPDLRLTVAPNPDPRITRDQTRWALVGQRGCCVDGFYLSFRNAVAHLLSSRHLAAQFGTTPDAVDAVDLQVGENQAFGSYARADDAGASALPADVLDELWHYGVVPRAMDLPAPWRSPGFPTHLTFACELGRAYRWGDLEFIDEQTDGLWRQNPERVANFIVGSRRASVDVFDVDFEPDFR